MGHEVGEVDPPESQRQSSLCNIIKNCNNVDVLRILHVVVRISGAIQCMFIIKITTMPAPDSGGRLLSHLGKVANNWLPCKHDHNMTITLLWWPWSSGKVQLHNKKLQSLSCLPVQAINAGR